MAGKDPFPGTTLGDFQIEGKLGQGGMGAVYRATQISLDRLVALKILPKALAEEEEFLLRFGREAKKLAQLTHANIVQIFAYGTTDGHTYMAMQFMEGGSLQDLLDREGKLDPREGARIGRDAARGLARAARASIIHRDIKPANILLGDEGEVRLGDFGLVKDQEESGQPLTQTGVVLGTPHYMAPEQCEGREDIDHRADLYALGLVLYQCLTGMLPATGNTPLQIIYNRLEKDLPPLRSVAPEVPVALAAIVEELLVKDRDARLQSADELAKRLDRWLSGASVTVAAETMQLPVPPRGKRIKKREATLPYAETPVLPVEQIPTARLVSNEEAAVLPTVAMARKATPPPSGVLVDSGKRRPPRKKKQNNTLLIVLAIASVGVFGCCIFLAIAAQING